MGLLVVLASGAIATESVRVGGCAGQSFEQCVQWCRDQYARPEEREERFACFDALEQDPSRKTGARPVIEDDGKGGNPKSPLEQLWNEPDGIAFLPYRQNYVMVTDTDSPNNAPTSPNPDNRVPYTYALNHAEIKFELSLKALVIPSRIIGHANSLWFGYTQQSFWQAFNAANSRPFQESDYEPELIFSHRFGEASSSSSGLQPLFLNFGAVHQSNGQSDPRSRSWNRAYAQLGLVNRLSADESYAVLIQPWWRFSESPANDNNPDIINYLGHGDVECLYWNGDNMFSLLARIRSLQADFSTPMLFLSHGKPKKQSLQLHLQLFTGYGESLIDYNQRHTTIGVGLSVPYGL